jgi:hypothetical protein
MQSPSTIAVNELSPELRKAHALRARGSQLRARDAEITERIERDLREREEVRAALRETEVELETMVQAPVAGGVDPTAWLPDELLWMILVQVLVGGTCERVCRRWHAVCAGATAKKEAWQWRWAGYTHGNAAPHTLLLRQLGGGADLFCLTTSLTNNTLYCGLRWGTIQVWSTVTNTHLQTLEGHTGPVHDLVSGKDGTVYSASGDTTVRIWSGKDGSHLGTIAGGHTHAVRCLAVGLDDTVYTGSDDSTIRVWTDRRDGSRLIWTLEGHTDMVWSLAVGTDGKVYSGSADTTIRMWSTVDGSHIGTLEGHTADVNALAVAVDGTVYSGSDDATLRVWSGRDGSAIRTLEMDEAVFTIAIGAGNTVIIGEGEGRVSAWNGGAAPARTLYMSTEDVHMLAIGQDGRLFVMRDHDLQVSCL